MAENDFGDNPGSNPEGNLYQTGELAEACGTTVRTVQYYDNKGLLAPTDYSEGGRRLYSQDDAERLRFILMLKSLGLKLAQIKGVLESPNRDAVLQLLLDEQAATVMREIDECTKRLQFLNAARADLQNFGKLMATTEPAMVRRMNDEKARTRWWIVMIVIGVFMDAAWISTLVLGIVTGVWWPFPVALVFVAAVGTWEVRYYSAHSTYLCPVCGAEFRPKLGAYFWSSHTPRTRKLTCPCCHRRDWCVEHYHAEPLELAPGQCVPGTCHCSDDVRAADGNAPDACTTDAEAAKVGDGHGPF